GHRRALRAAEVVAHDHHAGGGPRERHARIGFIERERRCARERSGERAKDARKDRISPHDSLPSGRALPIAPPRPAQPPVRYLPPPASSITPATARITMPRPIAQARRRARDACVGSRTLSACRAPPAPRRLEASAVPLPLRMLDRRRVAHNEERAFLA